MEVLLDINVSDEVFVVPQSLLGYEAREGSAQSGVYGIGACALATIPETQMSLRSSDDFMGEPLESLLRAECQVLTPGLLRDES